MYERFTHRARKVIQLANQEAQRFNYEYIGTEHILLGLIKEGSGVAAVVLKNLDVEPSKIRLEVEKLIQRGPVMVSMGRLPETPRAKKVIEYSLVEARILNHNYVGTEHILLGLLREQEGVAAQVLMNLGLKLEEVREEMLNLLGHGAESDGESKPRKSIWWSIGTSFSLRTLFLVVTLAALLAAIVRAIPELALFLSLIVGVVIAWAVMVLFFTGLVQGACSAVSYGFRRVFRSEDTPTTRSDRP